MQIFVVSLVLGISLDMQESFNNIFPLKMNVHYRPLAMVEIDNDGAASLIKYSNVVLAGKENEVLAASQYFNTIPEDLLTANIRVLAQAQPVAKQITAMPLEEVELPAIRKETREVYIKPDFADATVLLYCTHSSESYIPDSGQAKIEGKRGLINDVAVNLAQELSQKGLRAGFDDTIHDYPEYNASYTNSRETVKELLKENDEILALLDIHRDSIPGSTNGETVEIEGKKSARILIIVGTNERKPHPDWKENLAFAEKIYEEAEQLYPGLIKAVRTKAGTYNQEFHPRALLLEFGNDRNSFAEVKYATELFAEVLIKVLEKEIE